MQIISIYQNRRRGDQSFAATKETMFFRNIYDVKYHLHLLQKHTAYNPNILKNMRPVPHALTRTNEHERGARKQRVILRARELAPNRARSWINVCSPST